MLDKNPIKVVSKGKFLGVVFDRTLSYRSHVDYLKTNCLKALDIFKSSRPHRLGGRSENATPPLSSPSGVWLHRICGSLKTCSTETGPYPSPRSANCSWSFSHFSCKQPLCESTRDVFEKQTQNNVYELCSKTKNLS